MPELRMSEVFVPGGMPRLTYVSRGERRLEERLRRASDHLCKLVTVTGATKSGKTVLTQQIYSRDEAVWLDGGSYDREQDLWSDVLEQLGAFAEVQYEETSEESEESSNRIGGEGGASAGVVAKIAGSKTRSSGSTAKRSKVVSRSMSPKAAAVNALRGSQIPLVIDDFHYLRKESQRSVVKALKQLVFDGLPAVILAIPHRRYDAVRVEKEMTGRIEAIEVPPWDVDELLQIPTTGFDLLGVDVDRDTLARFAREAYGSPHLMQDFCRETCELVGIHSPCHPRRTLTKDEVDVEPVFKKVAESTSRTVFEKLARGPRQRSDRKRRRMSDGSSVDIYEAVLRAIARLKPGVETLEYEQIRASLRVILAETPPQAHEVSRVIEKMASISADDDASVPVIDWEKADRRLHITDPFFAFFLKWGVDEPR